MLKILQNYKPQNVAINVDSHMCYGFGNSETLMPYNLTAELKNGFILHAKGYLHRKEFVCYGAVIDNHVNY